MVSVLLLMFLAQARPVDKVVVDPEGMVHVVYQGGNEIRVPREEDQVGASDLAIADDKQTVGWLVQYENPSTTYTIPLMLVIHKSGKIIRKLGNGFAISGWHFVAGGKQVAFHTDTLHGNFAPHSELVDIETGRVVAEWDGNIDETAPAWTRNSGTEQKSSNGK